MSGYNTTLMSGYGEMFEAAGLGVFDVSTVFGPEDVGIFIGLTPDKPDRAITLMTYPVEDGGKTTVITGLQIRFRGTRDTREIENLSDQVYNLLHYKSHYVVNNIHVELSWRQSGAWMGQDGNQRVERVENYYLHAERAAPNQLP